MAQRAARGRARSNPTTNNHCPQEASSLGDQVNASPVLLQSRYNVSLVLLLVVVVFADCSCADDHAGQAVHPVKDSNRGFHIGDSCQDGCSTVIGNSYCNDTTNTCQCLSTHPIAIDGVSCVEPKNLYESCTYDQQCSSRNANSFCSELSSSQTQCSCRSGYQAEKAHEIPIRYECIINTAGPLTETTVPAIVGLFITLTILAFLLCFMFKLFTQSRFARTRAYADANIPPTIVLEDRQIDLEKQLYPLDDARVLKPSPSGSHISNFSSRRGSGNNNSNNSSGSNGGNQQQHPSQSRRSSNRSSFGDDKIQRNGFVITSDPSFDVTADCEVEQHITIVPNPRAKRRGSMADYAFPELHPRSTKKKEPDNLLILTRTKTDKHGRRHSVAVPLIPPPDGEKFEGGYHVERNPITGGAKLVPPPGEGKLRARSSSERRGGGRDSKNRSSDGGKGQQQKETKTGNSKQKDLLSIPVADPNAKRRHSYQSGVPGLSKEMDRLKVSSASGSKGSSPKTSGKRRASSARRSSRSGFLHFLDLAIAN